MNRPTLPIARSISTGSGRTVGALRAKTIAILFTAAMFVAPTTRALQATHPADEITASNPQPPTPIAATGAPTTSPNIQALKITVTNIEGIVQVRTGDDQPWQRAVVGMMLDQNAEFRTAPRSAVQFKIPPDQTITLDRLGTVKVMEAISDNGKLKTKLGMEYGRTRYDIESAGQEHEASISSPSSTLAIRGTKVSLYDQRPFTAVGTSLTGRASFRDAHKYILFGNKNAGTTKIDTNTGTSSGYALDKTIVDPTISRARTTSEAGLIAALFSSGSTVTYDFQKGIRVVTGGTPLTDQQLVPVLPNKLDFVLRWTAAGTDLNLAVISPGPTGQNNLVYPVGGLNVLKNGGSIAYDDRGGKHGGMEVTSFPANFPAGIYRFGSVLISGQNSPATMEVFYNGKLVPFFSSNDGTTTSAASYTASPINPAIAAGQAVGLIQISPKGGVTPITGLQTGLGGGGSVTIQSVPSSHKK